MDTMTSVVTTGRSGRIGLVLAAAAALLLVACAAEPPKPAPVAPAPAPVVATEPPKPAAPPVPDLSPAQAKAQAQKLAIDAVTQLQNGDEASATRTLEQALGRDFAHKLPPRLM